MTARSAVDLHPKRQAIVTLLLLQVPRRRISELFGVSENSLAYFAQTKMDTPEIVKLGEGLLHRLADAEAHSPLTKLFCQVVKEDRDAP